MLSCFLVIVQLIGCKDNANRGQNKMNLFIFCAEGWLSFAFRVFFICPGGGYLWVRKSGMKSRNKAVR
ncbi:hypothetical protein E5355_00855 [Bacteroides muris (ex Afrizal et al. 2022)]|uniref:Uncharacterized protein n=1 Tax=Bacteroides muris (ex Afrizal et al. 2022) TaxID=2516960 RepID=A0A4V3RCR6_9BACE|nr:hypothetical protein E5355_00855 [Bacteroides muris (ex Afrizal et al. 2022)]